MTYTISRTWGDPDKQTFRIKQVRQIINKYKKPGQTWIDPFPFDKQIDALEYLKSLPSNSADGALFDPPYSPNQAKRSYYRRIGDAVSWTWYIARVKDQIARIVKPRGISICFGWNTNGISKSRGFKELEILIIRHGAQHNDTLVIVEHRINGSLY